MKRAVEVYGKRTYLKRLFEIYLERGDIRETGRFQDNVVRLWERVKQDYPIVVQGTKGLLYWRFALNSVANYVKFASNAFSAGKVFLLWEC